jgi:hypothetical protein
MSYIIYIDVFYDGAITINVIVIDIVVEVGGGAAAGGSDIAIGKPRRLIWRW